MKELKAKFGAGLAKALKRDDVNYGVEDLFEMLQKGSWVEVHTSRSMAVGCPQIEPNGEKSLYWLHVTGTLQDIVSSIVPLAEEKARQLGATRIVQYGNPAYLRILPKAGFRLQAIKMEKRIYV